MLNTTKRTDPTQTEPVPAAPTLAPEPIQRAASEAERYRQHAMKLRSDVAQWQQEIQDREKQIRDRKAWITQAKASQPEADRNAEAAGMMVARALDEGGWMLPEQAPTAPQAFGQGDDPQASQTGLSVLAAISEETGRG